MLNTPYHLSLILPGYEVRIIDGNPIGGMDLMLLADIFDRNGILASILGKLRP
jgi:hypothetical protein